MKLTVVENAEKEMVLLTANVDGTEKLPAFIIEQSAYLLCFRCFKNVKSLFVEYFSKSKARMTSLRNGYLIWTKACCIKNVKFWYYRINTRRMSQFENK